MPKPSANERRLAKLLREAEQAFVDDNSPLFYEEFAAAFLARHGVLAVCAKTVPPRDWPDGVVGMVTLRGFLRRLARGAK